VARQVTNPQNPEVRRTTQNAAVVDRCAYGYKCLNLEVRAIAASSAIYLVTEHRVVRGASPYMSAGVCARRSPDPRLRCPAKPPRVRGARVPPVAVPPVAAAVTGPTRLKLPAGATSSRLGSGGARPQLVTERVAAAAKRPVAGGTLCQVNSELPRLTVTFPRGVDLPAMFAVLLCCLRAHGQAETHAMAMGDRSASRARRAAAAESGVTG
jgi:hypothetical protein